MKGELWRASEGQRQLQTLKWKVLVLSWERLAGGRTRREMMAVVSRKSCLVTD